jgi:hypothetical protein
MVLFYTDIHDEKISASNMKEAAIKAILLAYFKDLSHSTNYLKLSKLIKRINSVDEVLKMEEWQQYEFDRPMPKTHVMVYGLKKNTCFELASFERVGLKDVQVYMINRKKLVLPIKNLDVKVINGQQWKNKNINKINPLLNTCISEKPVEEVVEKENAAGVSGTPPV